LSRIVGQREGRGGKALGFDLAGAVATVLEFGDAPRVDVEADDSKMLGQRDCERQANVAEADDDDAGRFSVLRQGTNPSNGKSVRSARVRL
jgi:hypothetical protein